MTPPAVPDRGSFIFKLFNVGTAGHVALYRLTGGRMFNSVGGAPLVLLDHVGAKSGKKRTTPLIYLADGEDLIIVASRGGSPANPAWLHNLIANPDTEVEVRGKRTPVHATVMDSEERALYWPKLTAMYKDYDGYQARADREIPVLRLARV